MKKIKPTIKALALAANGFPEDPRGRRCVRMERVSKWGHPIALGSRPRGGCFLLKNLFEGLRQPLHD